MGLPREHKKKEVGNSPPPRGAIYFSECYYGIVTTASAATIVTCFLALVG